MPKPGQSRWRDRLKARRSQALSSDTGGGWHPHPDAIDDHVELRPDNRGRVTGLGAICDLRQEGAKDAHSQSFVVSEFVTLDDGRRVILHESRGFTIGWRSSGESGSGDIHSWNHETADSITRNVLNVVRPDDDECPDDHPWSWLASLAQAQGLHVTAEDLRSLPYEVILTESVHQWLERR